METNLDTEVCTSSSCESGTTSSDSDDSDVVQSSVMGLKPYQFETVISRNKDSESESDSESDDESNEDKKVNSWPSLM